jgi:hypothetical protein
MCCNPKDFNAPVKEPLEGEPTFTLLARDPDFRRLVSAWAEQRSLDIQCGLRPASDHTTWRWAIELAREGAYWRKRNNGAWTASPVVNNNCDQAAMSDEPVFKLFARDT